MDSPDKVQPSSHEGLTIQKSALIFRDVLVSVLNDESPFAKAPFVVAITQKYLEDKNQLGYFTTKEGFGANIVIHNGVAEPNIDLNLQEGLKSRNLKLRITHRLDKEDLTDEKIYQFAVGHEIGHLIQGLADFTSIEDQNITGLNEVQINKIKQDIDEYNKNIKTNKDIKAAQDYFQLIFKDDINRNINEASIDPNNYTDEEYLKYVNSSTEANADFISLWIMGMINPHMRNSPQNEGYNLSDWQKWANYYKIDAIHRA